MNDQVDTPQDNGDESQGHPAWQEILSILPDEFHPLIKPKLEEWDTKVQGKLQDLNKYDPYKPLVENNVPLESIQQAMWLAQQFETNPEAVVKQAIEAFGLEGFNTTPVSNTSDEDEDDEDYEDDDEYDEDNPLAGLENHPAYKELKQKYDEVDRILKSQQSKVEEEESATQLEEYLKGLHDEHGEFNDLFVTALLANGVDAEEAIQTYQESVKSDAQKLAEALAAQNGQQKPPPVIMGGAGNAGSGIPEQPIKMGDLKKGDVNDLVTQYLEQAARSSEAG